MKLLLKYTQFVYQSSTYQPLYFLQPLQKFVVAYQFRLHIYNSM